MTRALAACAAVLSTTALASAPTDWFASLYTAEGVELRTDERVFALFAVFNAAGYDVGPVTRQTPVPKVAYHPVRQLVRARVLGGDPEVRKAADAFFDAHPAALRTYVSYAVQGDLPPFVVEPKARDLAELKGFEQVLARAWSGWKLDELLQATQAESRAALKRYVPVLDEPLTKARAALKTPPSVEVIVMVNLLEAQNEVRAVTTESGAVLVIVGPSEKPNVEGVVRELARQTIEPAVTKQIAKWAGGAAVLKEAQLAGAPERTVSDYATALVTTALALRSTNASDAAWDAAASRGYFGIREVSKLFDDGKPVEGWILDAMQRVETRRPAKK
jgi:hypothetical protein